MTKQKTAMISSTALDLPEHREQAKEACLRQTVFPIGMEELPARDASGIRASLDMVDKADIYIGIYAHRYGWIPDGKDISITEMEFDRAVERGIPILVFLMHKDHPLTIEMVETGDLPQKKLAEFKKRAVKDRFRAEFSSDVDLRGLIIQALAALEKAEQEAAGEKKVTSFHPPSHIPAAPERYVAHPYTLLQTSEVVGRREELKLLTDWVTKNERVPRTTRLFCLVAIGGMGKSALTWKWFGEIAPNELPNLAGRLWWSFYESDAYFENFIIRACAYATGKSESEVRAMKSPEREDLLWKTLDEKPFLLVLDGLERILLAYARMDAAHLPDDDLDEQTANDIARYYGLPDDVRETYLEKHRLRQCADPRAGAFLRRLTRVRASRVLVSTRLYPAELQTQTAKPLPGCHAEFLRGLSDDDALALWRGFVGSERSGAGEQLLPLFKAFGNYPLLLRALAGEVANFRPAPGDFDRWRAANPDFNPAARLDLKNAKTHVLEFALRGLGEIQQNVLRTIAAFRMPAVWDTLQALFSGDGKPCTDDRGLDAVLTELEDRGLVGWDKKANRYDLHPIVRGVVWAALDPTAKRGIYGELHAYFDAAPRPPEWDKVESLEELTPAVELFDKLIGLERYEDAFAIFRHHLDYATIYRLCTSRLRAELLERLFPDGVAAPPRLGKPRSQGFTLNALALAVRFNGEPGRALPLFRRVAEIDEREKDVKNFALALCNLAETLLHSGHLRESEEAANRALKLGRDEKERHPEGMAEYRRGLMKAVCGQDVESDFPLRRSIAMFVAEEARQGEGLITAYLAQRSLWRRQHAEALPLAQNAWELALVRRHEHDFIRAARLHGEAALGLGDLFTAEERLQHALTRARAVNLVEEELLVLTALAELHRRRKEYDVARELLEHVWAPAERGPYPLLHADACNVLARIERDLGNRDAAAAAAARAFRLAWCDGPPYAYHHGLTNARDLLHELGAPEPNLPPFDPAKFPPLPEVELNPHDEFHVPD